jgi:ABC-type transport system involved in Fe-S cluster assembly fused permease/ATPase subunit
MPTSYAISHNYYRHSGQFPLSGGFPLSNQSFPNHSNNIIIHSWFQYHVFQLSMKCKLCIVYVSNANNKCTYLKVTIICMYIFLRFWVKTHFASTKFCDLYTEMVQGQQILMFYATMVLIANDCGYKILHFWANPQKYQTLVTAKNSHLKVL